MRYRGPLCLLLVVACAGCAVTKPTAPKPVRPSAAPVTSAPILAAGEPRIVHQLGDATQLTGKVKIISDNGGGIISDNGGGIISNNGGTLISNNGGSYRLAATRTELLLADAEIRLYDASGRLLVDDAGKPLAAKSDGKGGYTLKAVLPAENLVLRAPLFNGGELSAMLASPKPGPRTRDLGTASSIGAAYVLATFVKGDQQVYDKLPDSEASNLEAALESSEGLLEAAPTYKPADLVALAEQLRAKAPAVDRKLEDIKVLLLGQANLGNGRRATEVPLGGMGGLALDPKGNLLVGEDAFGRVRRVAPDGILTTYVDAYHGEVKRNFHRLQDLAVAPDGSLYASSKGDFKVYRVAPDGSVTAVAGTGANAQGPGGGKATETALLPYALAAGADGTLYLGEARGTKDTKGAVPRLLAVGADGQLRELDLGGVAQPYTRIQAVEAAADGTLYFLFKQALDGGTDELYRLRPGAKPERLLGGLDLLDDGDLALAPDGTLYVSEPVRRKITAVDPTGKATEVPASEIAKPAYLAVAADGRLYAGDIGAGRVRVRRPDGKWELVAGADPTVQAGFTDLAVNTPGGVAFDDQGRLLVAEGGSNTIKRFDGKTFVPIVGTTSGSGGDGGPASAAQLASPGGLAFQAGNLWIMDLDNNRIRVVGPDGVIQTAVGAIEGDVALKKKVTEAPARQYAVKNALGLALTPDGRPIFCDVEKHQLLWLRADGMVERAVGGPDLPAPPAEGGPALAFAPTAPTGLVFDREGNLYIADTFTCQIYKVTGLGTPQARIAPFAGQPLGVTLARAGGPLPNEEGKAAKDATLIGPGGLCFDAAGNMYVGELGTMGMAGAAPLLSPQAGSLLESLPPSGARIRKIAPDGTITTVAGPGGKLYPDPGADDALTLPLGIAVAPDGRMVVMDGEANLIRFLPAGSF